MQLLIAAMCLAQSTTPAWRSLPEQQPWGERAATGSNIVSAGERQHWKRPPFAYNAAAATGRKQAKVVVLIYDPVMKTQNGKRLGEWLGGTDPQEASRILADVVCEASWGYINYDIVEILRLDRFPPRLDGTRYDEASYLAARDARTWHPASASYRKAFEEYGLIERFRNEGITELWLWGADGFHIDEGFSEYGYNNWWLAIANTDEELSELAPWNAKQVHVPRDGP